MISLKDNRLTTKKHGVVYCEEYVKEAVLEDIEDIENLYKSIDNDDLATIKKKLEIHIKFKKRRFGDFEK